MKSYLPVVLIFLSSCITLQNRNGDKYKNFAPVSDHYRHFKKKNAASEILPFDSLTADLKNEGSNTRFRYLQVTDLEEIQKVHPRFLLLFWLPTCPAQRAVPALAKKLDSLNLPAFLISETFDLSQINAAVDRIGYTNQVVFILPHSTGGKILKKKISFIQEKCPACYEFYKDEVAGATGLFVERDSISKVLFNNAEPEIVQLFSTNPNP